MSDFTLVSACFFLLLLVALILARISGQAGLSIVVRVWAYEAMGITSVSLAIDVWRSKGLWPLTAVTLAVIVITLLLIRREMTRLRQL